MKRTQTHYIVSVRVGPKGQIVIPKEVRDMFAIQPGDTLLLLADAAKGIALERQSVFTQIAQAIFAGRAKEIYPDQAESDSQRFAQAIMEAAEATEDDP